MPLAYHLNVMIKTHAEDTRSPRTHVRYIGMGGITYQLMLLKMPQNFDVAAEKCSD